MAAKIFNHSNPREAVRAVNKIGINYVIFFKFTYAFKTTKIMWIDFLSGEFQKEFVMEVKVHTDSKLLKVKIYLKINVRSKEIL